MDIGSQVSHSRGLSMSGPPPYSPANRSGVGMSDKMDDLIDEMAEDVINQVVDNKNKK